MLILHKAMHIIDYENVMANAVAQLPEEFNQYLSELMTFVNRNESVKKYKPRSQNTQVANCVRAVLSASSDAEDRRCPDVALEMFKEIAERLLDVEARTQERITRLNQRIKKGSLVQALLFNEDSEEYVYVAAKVEHTAFFDDVDLRARTGIASEKKSVWKSCVLECIVNNEEVSVGAARVYMDSRAVYWSDGFLELDEMVSDEANTHAAFKYINHTLAKVVKPTAPSDYVVLRNTVVSYLRTEGLVDYTQMITDVLDQYIPIELTGDELTNLKSKLDELPEKRGFDRQFRAVPGAIGARKITKYQVNSGVELRIDDVHAGDIVNTIEAVEERGGLRFIKIRTDNEATFAAFKRPHA